jgi:hypothetical protein
MASDGYFGLLQLLGPDLHYDICERSNGAPLLLERHHAPSELAPVGCTTITPDSHPRRVSELSEEVSRAAFQLLGVFGQGR